RKRALHSRKALVNRFAILSVKLFSRQFWKQVPIACKNRTVEISGSWFLWPIVGLPHFLKCELFGELFIYFNMQIKLHVVRVVERSRCRPAKGTILKNSSGG